MKLSLLVAEGTQGGTAIAVTRSCLLIGAAAPCHVRAASPDVSDRHCALLVRGDHMTVRDLDSVSGTFVNDRQLRGGQLELRDGDFLRVGPLHLVVLTEADPSEEAATTVALGQSEGLVPTKPAADTQEMPCLGDTLFEPIEPAALSVPAEAEAPHHEDGFFQTIEPSTPAPCGAPSTPWTEAEEVPHSIEDFFPLQATSTAPSEQPAPTSLETAIHPLLDKDEDEEAAAPSAEAEPPKHGLLELHCPNCDAKGFIPWGRLNSVLCCSGCRTWYRLAAGGKLLAVAAPQEAATRGTLRAYSQNGRERKVAVPTQPPARRRLWEGQRGWEFLGLIVHVFGRRWVALLLLLALIGGGALLVGRYSAAKPRPLPGDLEGRARLLAEAWVGHDTPILVRLTDPVSDRQLRRWLADHPSPVTPGQFNRRHTTFETRIIKQDEQSAQVEVRVGTPDQAAGSPPLLVEESWIARGGVWYFVPPLPGRLALR